MQKAFVHKDKMAEEDAIEKVQERFELASLKPEQKTISASLLHRGDCVALLPMGYGKLLPYDTLVSVRREMDLADAESNVIVSSPLAALIQE